MKFACAVAMTCVLGIADRHPIPERGPSQALTSDEFLLEPGRAGRMELGMSVDQVYERFGRENNTLVDLFKEGLFSPALQIRLAGPGTAISMVTDIGEWPCGEFSVRGIDVLDGRFRTKDGFGVGSTAGELKRSYPFKISEEEGAHAAIVDALKMSFALSHEGPVDDQRVVGVWIWPDPVAVRRKRCPGRAPSAPR